MKAIFYTFIIFMYGFFLSFNTHAQYVPIPDSNFCHWLKANGYKTCMSNDMLDTTCNKVLIDTALQINSTNIRNLYGIQFFKSAITIYCNGNPKLISLPPLPNTVVNLYVEYDSLTVLASLPDSLKVLYCNRNQLISLASLPGTLIMLLCSDNPNLSCLPVLPSHMKFVNYDNTSVTCLPNRVTVSQPIYSSINIDTIPICAWPSPCQLSVSDIKPDNIGFNVYPNPADYSVNLNIPWQTVCTITDITGRQLQTITLQKGLQNIHLDNYANGIYLLDIIPTGSAQRVVKKIVVQK